MQTSELPGEPPWGLVLAGGAGMRMGGEKPLKRMGGKRLIDLALAKFQGVCDQVAVAAGDVASLAEVPCRLLADRWPGQGPLAALATAFLETPAPSFILLAVDIPLLNLELLRLLKIRGPGLVALTLEGPKGPEPLVSYYDRRCLPTALRLLKKDERRLRMLLKAVRAPMIPREQVQALDPEGISFFNVNFPRDLEEARRLISKGVNYDTQTEI